VLRRAHDVVHQFPFPRLPRAPDSDLFVAGHGTPRDPQSRKAVEVHADRIRARGEYRSVHAVFLEESPRVSDCCALAQSRHVVVVPFFISDGMHTQEDIPVLLGEPERLVQQRLARGQPPWRNPTERMGHLIWYSPAVGTDAGVADILLARVREAALGPESSI
jgi:sirohydrochlorin cobaltochelatase